MSPLGHLFLLSQTFLCRMAGDSPPRPPSSQLCCAFLFPFVVFCCCSPRMCFCFTDARPAFPSRARHVVSACPWPPSGRGPARLEQSSEGGASLSPPGSQPPAVPSPPPPPPPTRSSACRPSRSSPWDGGDGSASRRGGRWGPVPSALRWGGAGSSRTVQFGKRVCPNPGPQPSCRDGSEDSC